MFSLAFLTLVAEYKNCGPAADPARGYYDKFCVCDRPWLVSGAADSAVRHTYWWTCRPIPYPLR